MSNLIIKPNEHVLISGTTGTGKSYFAEHYLAHYDHVVKLDTKHEYRERMEQGVDIWSGLKRGTDFEVVTDLEDLVLVDTPKIIFAPDYLEQSEELFDELFRWCFERGHTQVWIDELFSVVSGVKIPKQLLRIYTQGRSKFTSAWSCTQRPTGIPMIIPANTTHFITYYLNWLEDRKKMYSFTGCEELLEPPNKENYEFWYCKSGQPHAYKAKLKIT